jgi:hypothetical protein
MNTYLLWSIGAGVAGVGIVVVGKMYWYEYHHDAVIYRKKPIIGEVASELFEESRGRCVRRTRYGHRYSILIKDERSSTPRYRWARLTDQAQIVPAEKLFTTKKQINIFID